MRTLTLTALLACATLAACAGDPGTSTYAAETRRLAEDCEARGGVLVNTSDRSGHPQTDNVCKITGGAATRIPPSN